MSKGRHPLDFLRFLSITLLHSLDGSPYAAEEPINIYNLLLEAGQ